MPARTELLIHGPLDERTVHLCVDMQNLYDEGAPWATPWFRRVLPRVVELASEHADRTVFTRFIPAQDPRAAGGGWRAFYDKWADLTLERIDPALLELAPPLRRLVPPALQLDKRVYSAFHGSGLRQELRRRRARALVISGTETDVCVLASVMDAVDLGLRVVVARDAVCSSSDRAHDALMTLYHERLSVQIEVADTATILSIWRA